MKERCKPPQFDEIDWGQLDFTRWNLDAVAPDAVGKAIATLTQQFFESPEWQENVQVSLPALQAVALGVFRDQAQDLRERRKASAQEFERRTAAAKALSDAMRRAMAAAAAPQVPAPTPDSYHLAVRVTGADASLGFSGLVVEIGDPRNANAVAIASGTTDEDGNVTLTVGAELVKELDKRDTTVTVLSPAGKVLARLADGVCIRRDQVETKVITVKENAETAPLKAAAQDARASRESLLESLGTRTQSLATEQDARLARFDCTLQDVDATVAELEKPVDLAELFERAKPRDGAPPTGGGDSPRGNNPPGNTPQPAPSPRSPAAPAPAETKPQPGPRDTATKPAPAPAPARATRTTARTKDTKRKK